MGWRDRLRRRAATPSAAAPDREAPGTAGAAAPDAPGPSVPGDWDGGWRRTAAPELTVSRAPLGVSDGLAFRAGLAAWQNPSFDSGLGHALLPAAPAGLVRGVTRPAAPRATYTAGGPLLLRALRPEGADGAEAVASDGARADGTPAIARRPVPGERTSGSTGSRSGSSAVRPPGGDAGGDTRAGKAGSGAAAPRTRGLTATDSPAVLSASPAAVQRAVEPGTSPVVAPADTGRPPVAARTPLVRRVAVVPSAAADGTATRPAAEPNPGRTSATRGASGGRTPSGPAVRRAATQATGPHPEPARTSGADGPPAAVRPSPSGPRLTVARRPAGPVRRVTAVRSAAPPAPTPDASGTTTPAGPSTDSTAPVQRAATPPRGRAPLGAPLSELPSTATPLGRDAPAPGAGSAPGPTLPVVQRQGDTSMPYDSGTSATKGTASAGPADAPRRTPAADGSGARARGGLGAPLPELPASAALPGSAASPAPRASHTGPGPDVQRAPGADAPLLGTANVRRSPPEHSTGTGGTPMEHGNGPATPLVTPSPAHAPDRPETANTVATGGAGGSAAAGEARRPGSGGSRADAPTSGSSRADGPRSGGRTPRRPAVPGPVVVARAVAPGTADTRPTAVADPRPLTVTGSAAHSATAAAPRTLSLLAARPLTLSTRTPEGAAPPTAARSGSRPVVAARWPGAPSGAPAHRAGPSAVSPAASPGGSGAPARPLPAPSTSAPTSAPAPAAPRLQRAATAHSGAEGTRGTRGTPGTPGQEAGGRTSGSPAPVQRVPVVRPTPPRPVTAGAATAVPAKPLPVTAPQAPPLADRPAGVTAPVGPVPVVRPRTVAAGPATPVQRDAAAFAGADPLKGVQVKEVPARGRQRSSSAPPAPTSAATSTSGRAAARRRPERAQDDPGLDLDDLARRLIDPVARLLRTELRRGRERTGRPYDGRR
ncbi:hypothetical protein [Streptomyces sp. NPDC057623]|uniref:hypothetical protein n=1 Tax=Streptomyces sp. NPDC057623 TaxID=3346187 RepID=UPI0036BECD3D